MNDIDIMFFPMYFSDRKFDVSLRPQTDEYCTNKKPCVSYGLSSVFSA